MRSYHYEKNECDCRMFVSVSRIAREWNWVCNEDYNMSSTTLHFAPFDLFFLTLSTKTSFVDSTNMTSCADMQRNAPCVSHSKRNKKGKSTHSISKKSGKKSIPAQHKTKTDSKKLVTNKRLRIKGRFLKRETEGFLREIAYLTYFVCYESDSSHRSWILLPPSL